MTPVLAVLSALVWMQAPEPPPRIEPPDLDLIQSGTSIRLSIRGEALKTSRQVVFHQARGLLARIGKRSADRVQVLLSASPDAPEGARELRVVTSGGVSNRILIHVGNLPVRAEAASHGNRAEAQKLRYPCIVPGRLESPAQRDVFSFVPIAQPLRVLVRAQSLASALDPVVTVVNLRGRPVAWGSPRAADGDIEVHLPSSLSGRHFIQVRDLRYRGGSTYRYQLSVTKEGATPKLDTPYVFPLAATAGASPWIAVRGAKLKLDLGGTPAGTNRVPHPGGSEGDHIPLLVVAGPTTQEPESSASPKRTPLTPPAFVSGTIGIRGEVDRYPLRIEKKVRLRCAVRCSEFRSPLDPLLEVFDGQGKRVAVADDAGTSRDAALDHTFAPGSYEIRVRSLIGQGSGNCVYLLSVTAPTPLAAGYEVRFLPDTPRVRRGSHTQLWCEVVRKNGFAGKVKLSFPDLPAGVRIDPVTLEAGNGWTAVFSAQATAEAALGPVPLQALATTEDSTSTQKRLGVPERDQVAVRKAWLTVLPDARFAVSPLGPTKPEVQRRWEEERIALKERIQRRDGVQIGAATNQFLDGLRRHEFWEAPRIEGTKALSGARFEPQEDGSLRVQGKRAPTDTYTIAATTGLGRLAALRLDVLPDASTPSGGLGRAKGHGNFVLSRVQLFVGIGDEPLKEVALHKPQARFSQAQYPIARTLDGNKATGWATAPQMAKANWALFQLREPVHPTGGKRIRLRVVLDQQHGSDHVLARFRLAVSGKPLPATAAIVPSETAIAARRPQPRSAEAVQAYSHTLTPHYRQIAQRILAIEEGRGNDPRIQKIEASLREETPERIALREAWIAKTAAQLTRWHPIRFETVRSGQGIRFLREKGGVIRAVRPIASRDDYELTGKAPAIPRITAIRLTTLPTPALKAGGAGLAGSGNFVLTGVSLRARSEGAPGQAKPVPFRDAEASYAQTGYPVKGTLDGNPRTGWAVYPQVDQPHVALWRLRKPLDLRDSSTLLRLKLEHQSIHERHQLGRFRIWVTDSAEPTLRENGLPSAVALALTTPAKARTKAQSALVRSHYRRVAPSMDTWRRELARLRAEQAVYPPRTEQGGRTQLAVQVRRAGYEGKIRIDLVGFSAGRTKNGKPKAISTDLKVTPVTVDANTPWAVLEIEAEPKATLGTRPVLVRATSKVDGRTVTEFSPAIPLTVLPRR